MRKRHATEPEPTEHGVYGLTLCKRIARDVAIDNADPTCKRCLRVIDARLRAIGER